MSKTGRFLIGSRPVFSLLDFVGLVLVSKKQGAEFQLPAFLLLLSLSLRRPLSAHCCLGVTAAGETFRGAGRICIPGKFLIAIQSDFPETTAAKSETSPRPRRSNSPAASRIPARPLNETSGYRPRLCFSAPRSPETDSFSVCSVFLKERLAFCLRVKREASSNRTKTSGRVFPAFAPKV